MPPVRSSMLGMRAGGWAAAAPAPRPPACGAWREARRHSAAKSRNISEKSSGNYCIREGDWARGCCHGIGIEFTGFPRDMLPVEARIPDFRKSGEPSYFMNTSAKIQTKGQVTIPTSVRRQAGLSKGDLVDFAFQRGKIVITPKLVIDRSEFPNADDEYTPAQRRMIDARLEAAAAEVRKGNVSAAFDNIADFAAALKADANQLKGKTRLAILLQH